MKYWNLMKMVKQIGEENFKATRMTYLLFFCVMFFSNCKMYYGISQKDWKNWKNDTLGCRNYRINMYNQIDSSETYFLNKSIETAIKYFGKPDSIKNYQGNKIRYFYYLEEGSQCYNRKDSSYASLFYISVLNDTILSFGGMKR